MATVIATLTALKTVDQVTMVKWTPLISANAVGDVFETPGYSDRCVQISGTWGTGTVVLQGSNDNSTWFTLTDPQGNAISTTVDKLEQVSELTRYVRPKMTGANGTDSITVELLAKKVR